MIQQQLFAPLRREDVRAFIVDEDTGRAVLAFASHEEAGAERDRMEPKRTRPGAGYNGWRYSYCNCNQPGDCRLDLVEQSARRLAECGL